MNSGVSSTPCQGFCQFAVSFYRFSEDKKSVTSIEEELFHLYSETESDKCGKKHQITELQKEESQALASDNYDLAENISNRIDQLKADLESSHYRLPANDKKVKICYDILDS